MTRTGEEAVAGVAAGVPAGVPAGAPDVAAAAPRRGRPRSEAAEQAIVGAVLRLLEQGYPLALLSIEGIAGEAGVGKATIYRRWPNKEELLLDVLQRLDEPEPDPALLSASVRDALVAALEFLRRAALARRSHSSLALISNELRSMPELYRRYHEKVIEPRRERMRQLLARGVAQGEIRGDIDLDLLGELVIGPMLSRTLLRPGAPLEDPTLSATIVDTLLQGLAPQPSADPV
ncbi:TetR/AcrR family transcriptional regulator [Streptacidiphilus sp. N1-3]|uniref:TetR/AcrR family transcriptional regulator n=1 Tax=Streptacidiphilus alkalitolerans TaxID=3342712 RepID=A0ABV6WUX1_9ACTN